MLNTPHGLWFSLCASPTRNRKSPKQFKSLGREVFVKPTAISDINVIKRGPSFLAKSEESPCNDDSSLRFTTSIYPTCSYRVGPIPSVEILLTLYDKALRHTTYT